MNSCPRCNYPEIYTEGEKRNCECYCGNCFYHFNSQERINYLKHLKKNGLHVTRPENYDMTPNELDSIRHENAKMYHRTYRQDHVRSELSVNWNKANPEKVKAYLKEYYQKNKEKIKAKQRAKYKNDPEPFNRAQKKYLAKKGLTIK